MKTLIMVTSAVVVCIALWWGFWEYCMHSYHNDLLGLSPPVWGIFSFLGWMAVFGVTSVLFQLMAERTFRKLNERG